MGVDAVMYPKGWTPEGHPATSDGRLAALRELLDSRGRPMHFRNQATHFFVTLDLTDTINFPIGHPHAESPRYDWIERGGARLGTLKPEDK